MLIGCRSLGGKIWLTHPEHAKQGVRCIAFHPGGIAETGMGQAAPEQFRSRLYDTGKDSTFPDSIPLSPTVLFFSLMSSQRALTYKRVLSKPRGWNSSLLIHTASRLPRRAICLFKLGHGAAGRVGGPNCERGSTEVTNPLWRPAR